MSVASDKKRHYRTISKTCYTVNFFDLFLHTFYLILFLVAKFYVLAIITGAVVALYGFFFLMIKLKKYYPYVLMCGNEFLEGMKLEKWVELADSKMYFGKNAGKNQTVF